MCTTNYCCENTTDDGLKQKSVEYLLQNVGDIIILVSVEKCMSNACLMLGSV